MIMTQWKLRHFWKLMIKTRLHRETKPFAHLIALSCNCNLWVLTTLETETLKKKIFPLKLYICQWAEVPMILKLTEPDVLRRFNLYMYVIIWKYISNTSNNCKTATSENNTCLAEYIKINLALAKIYHISTRQLQSDSFLLYNTPIFVLTFKPWKHINTCQ